MRKWLVTVPLVLALPLSAADGTEEGFNGERFGNISTASSGAEAGLGLSMVGWGVGMSAGIAILSATIYQRKADKGDSNSHAHAHSN